MRACCWVLVITCCWGCSSSSTSDHVDEEIQRLKSWFASVRQDAAKELGWTKDRRAVEPLIAALKDRDCRVRYEAMKALGEIKDPRAVGPLIAAMKEVEGARMQEVAANALVKIGAPTVDPMVAELRDHKSKVGIWAVIVLGEIKDSRAVVPLVAALKEGDRDNSFITGALVTIGVSVVEPSLALLQDSNPDVRSAAAWMLGEIKDDHVIKPLIAALEDRSSTVRKTAADALQKRGYEPSTQSQRITFLMAEQDWGMLVKIGRPAVESLMAALKDDTSQVRMNAAKALGDIKDERAIGPLVNALRACHAHMDETKTFGEALLCFDAAATEPLMSALRDGDSLVQYATRDLLIKIGIPAVEPLIAVLIDEDFSMRDAAGDALAKINTRTQGAALSRISNPTMNLLFAALKGSDPRVRQLAAKALATVKDTRAVAPLAAALEDSDMFVRLYSIEALARIGDVRAVEPLVTALKNSNYFAGLALAKFGAPAVKPLVAMLGDANRILRQHAAIALVEMGEPAIVPVLAALSDKNPLVRHAVARSLTKIEPTRRMKSALDRSTPGGPGCEGQVQQVFDPSDLRKFHRRVPTPVVFKMKESGVIEPLTALLRNKDVEVRRAVAEALLSIDLRDVDLWLAALKDSDNIVRLVAANALENINDSRTVEPLIAALQDNDSCVATAAARELARLKDRRAIEPLVAALPGLLSQTAVGHALDSFGWKPRTEREKVCWKMCRGQMAELDQAWEQSRRILLEDLRSGDERRTANAVCVCVRIGREDMVPELLRVLNENGCAAIATICLNSGHKPLEDAALLWAEMNGFPSGKGLHYLRVPWGGWRSSTSRKQSCSTDSSAYGRDPYQE